VSTQNSLHVSIHEVEVTKLLEQSKYFCLFTPCIIWRIKFFKRVHANFNCSCNNSAIEQIQPISSSDEHQILLNIFSK
jgi:hypothetical protein